MPMVWMEIVAKQFQYNDSDQGGTSKSIFTDGMDALQQYLRSKTQPLIGSGSYTPSELFAEGGTRSSFAQVGATSPVYTFITKPAKRVDLKCSNGVSSKAEAAPTPSSSSFSCKASRSDWERPSMNPARFVLMLSPAVVPTCKQKRNFEPACWSCCSLMSRTRVGTNSGFLKPTALPMNLSLVRTSIKFVISEPGFSELAATTVALSSPRSNMVAESP